MNETADLSVDDLRAALAAARTAREAASLAFTEASAANHHAERDVEDALRALHAADPLYDVLAQCMDSADLDSHAYDHEYWCVRVDRFEAALRRRGYQIVKVPA